MTIQRNLKGFAQSQPGKICLAFGKSFLTYREFAAITEDMALRLAAQFEKGAKVVLKLNNPLQQLCYLFAAAQAGLIVILIDSKSSPELDRRVMAKSGAALMIDEYYILPEEKASSLPVVEEGDIFLGALSSGSTGQPKVIWRDHQSWTRAFPIQSKVFNLNGADRLFLVNSLVYTANLNSCLQLLDQGGSVIFADGSWPRSWIKEILKQEITALFMVPANYRILVKALVHPLPKIKSLVSAGAKIDLVTIEKILDKFPQGNFYEYYGASELGHVTFSSQEDLLKFPDSVGQAFPGVEFYLDEVGRITVASPYLAPDYRPRATIGDLGQVNSEGYLFLLGRENGMINKGGIKIIPEQVEIVLQKCPGVRDVLVKGETDPIKGQKVAAWIVPQKNNKPSLPDLKQFCQEKLAKQYRPDFFYFTDKIPRNANGKIIRRDGE